MKRCIIICGLVALTAAISLNATQQEFMFGVWASCELPDSVDVPAFIKMLHDTLHFNTWQGPCFREWQLQYFTAESLKVISSNDGRWNDTVAYWPRVYAEACYSVWESEGSKVGPFDLIYRGGDTVFFGATKCRHFTAIGQRVDSLVQTGPSSPGVGYAQAGWYWPQHLPVDTVYRYQYDARLRFKLGAKPPECTNDTVAVFYIRRVGEPDEVMPTQNDTMINQTPFYILNSSYGSSETDFIWSGALTYTYNNTYFDYGNRYVWSILYQVRWYGTRDIYIDQVKITDLYGFQFWEGDTATALGNLESQINAYFGDSPTIVGWFISDDNVLSTNRDNVFSTRRVDSLLTHRFSHKPGFATTYSPEMTSLFSYSNVSFNNFPIYSGFSQSSDVAYGTSIQKAWDNYLDTLEDFRQVAASKGVKSYAILQGFEGDNWRRPTGGENLCQVNLALAYDVDGILYWAYRGDIGFVYGSGVTGPRTATWGQVKDTVGPYIDKMGPIFADLEWQGAWKWGDTPPPCNDLSAIQCNEYTNDPYEGDYLYLQVAHFHDSAGCLAAEYYFLVNRRCLPWESITGTVFFPQLVCGSKAETVYWVTDMENLTTTQCGHKDVWEGDPPYGHYFEFSIAPGAGKLYKLEHCDWRHGDANGDGAIDVSDVVFLTAYIFGGPAPDPLESGDADCDNVVDMSDVVYLVQYIFSSGPVPCAGC